MAVSLTSNNSNNNSGNQPGPSPGFRGNFRGNFCGGTWRCECDCCGLTYGIKYLLFSTEWVDYVEEPMKYQALWPHFFSVVVGWRALGVGGGGVGGVGGVVGPHDTPHHGGHQMPPPMLFFDMW